jgi:hypothetical protein
MVVFARGPLDCAPRRFLLTLSGVLGSGAFAVLRVGFGGMLLAPRVDGRSG